MYKNVLEKSGLKSGEAEIYDLLLQFGDSPASTIAQKATHKRGMVYKILEDLKTRGIVSTYKKNKKTYFKPEHPYKLMENIEDTLKEAKNQVSTLEAILPQLVSSFSAMENKPGVKVFDGIEGIKEVYKDTLKENAEIWAILQTSEVEPKLYKWLNTYYGPQRAKQNIWAKVIVAEDTKTRDYVQKNEQYKRETRIVPKKKFPVAIEMNIYGDKVAFINFKRGESYLGVIINNKLVAETMRAMFTLAWEAAGFYSQNPVGGEEISSLT